MCVVGRGEHEGSPPSKSSGAFSALLATLGSNDKGLMGLPALLVHCNCACTVGMVYAPGQLTLMSLPAAVLPARIKVEIDLSCHLCSEIFFYF